MKVREYTDIYTDKQETGNAICEFAARTEPFFFFLFFFWFNTRVQDNTYGEDTEPYEL